MSDPTYRIDVEHKPEEHGNLTWIARVVRLSDEVQVGSRWAASADSAAAEAQFLVADLNAKQPGFSVFVDDDGRPVEGHSVKA